MEQVVCVTVAGTVGFIELIDIFHIYDDTIK